MLIYEGPTIDTQLHVRANSKPWARAKEYLQTSGPGRVGYRTISAAVQVPKSPVVTIIHEWKKFGTTQNLPRLKLSDRDALGQGGEQEPKGHSDKSSSVTWWEMGEPSRRSTIQAALHQI